MDELRYGYRVWIDEATAMPLKTQLRGSHDEVLEQIVFTELRLPAHIADSELEPAVDAHGYRWVRHDTDAADNRELPVSWEAGELPPGFHMTVSARQVLPSGPVEHLVFSDGLASVSVFVELSRDPAGADVKDDAATLGSSSAYATVVQGYRVTAVGEVPADTVRSIAQSIRTSAAAGGLAEVAGPTAVRRALGPVSSAAAAAAASDSSSLFGAAAGATDLGLAPAVRGSPSGGVAFGSTGSLSGQGPGSFGAPAAGAGFGGGVAGGGPHRH